jgi:hypothetical protein
MAQEREMKYVSIKLTEYDWIELANFVGGDLSNMDESCPVAKQMRRICQHIRKECATKIIPRANRNEVKL